MLMHHVYGGPARAHALFQRNVEYIVRDGQVVIVDEFTGRVHAGRRWSTPAPRRSRPKGSEYPAGNPDLGSITFRTSFRLYDKLSGMTGTADDRGVEFQQIYGLDVVAIPTNRPAGSDDQPTWST